MRKTYHATILASFSPMLAQAQSPSTSSAADPLDPEDQALVELELNDPTGEAWQVMRSDLSEGRDLGQINIQRFHGGMPWIRIPAFFNLPVALTPADLNAGDADVAIMGAEFYNSAPVQSYAPTTLRANTKSTIYHAWGDWEMPHLTRGLKVFQEQNVVDYGDAPVHPYSIALSTPEVRKMVAGFPVSS